MTTESALSSTCKRKGFRGREWQDHNEASEE